MRYLVHLFGECSLSARTRYRGTVIHLYSQQWAIRLICFCSVGTVMRSLVYEQQICRHSNVLFGSWTAIHNNIIWFICFWRAIHQCVIWFMNNSSMQWYLVHLFLYSNSQRYLFDVYHSNVIWFICFWTAIHMHYSLHLFLFCRHRNTLFGSLFWEQLYTVLRTGIHFYSQQCAVWLIGFCSVGTAMRNWVYEQQICRHSDDLFGSWTAIHSNVNWFICFLNSNSHALFVSSGSVRHINALLGSWTAIHSNVSWFICFWTAILMRYLFHLVLLGT